MFLGVRRTSSSSMPCRGVRSVTLVPTNCNTFSGMPLNSSRSRTWVPSSSSLVSGMPSRPSNFTPRGGGFLAEISLLNLGRVSRSKRRKVLNLGGVKRQNRERHALEGRNVPTWLHDRRNRNVSSMPLSGSRSRTRLHPYRFRYVSGMPLSGSKSRTWMLTYPSGPCPSRDQGKSRRRAPSRWTWKPTLAAALLGAFTTY